MMTWAEDRATVGTAPSADPGAKTEGRAEDRLACSARSSHPLRDWHQAINPSRQQPRASTPHRGGQNFRKNVVIFSGTRNQKQVQG
jgi:hypothetical protein